MIIPKNAPTGPGSIVITEALAPAAKSIVSERGTPMSTRNVGQIVERAGHGLDFPVDPHMLRHGCGYKLINDGVDVRTVQQYQGHASINRTVIYTKLGSRRFDGLWRD